MKQKRVSVLVDENLSKKFERRIETLGHNKSALIRKFIRDYLIETEAQPFGFPKGRTSEKTRTN